MKNFWIEVEKYLDVQMGNTIKINHNLLDNYPLSMFVGISIPNMHYIIHKNTYKTIQQVVDDINSVKVIYDFTFPESFTIEKSIKSFFNLVDILTRYFPIDDLREAYTDFLENIQMTNIDFFQNPDVRKLSDKLLKQKIEENLEEVKNDPDVPDEIKEILNVVAQAVMNKENNSITKKLAQQALNCLN